MTHWTPGLSFAAVLAEAPITYIRQQLGEELCRLLDLIDGGTAPDSRLRSVANVALDPELLVTQPHRREFLRLLPPAKQAELAQRTGHISGGSIGPLQHLQDLKWTPDQRTELLEFLGFTVDRSPNEAVSALSVVEPEYGLFAHQRDTATRVKERLYAGHRRVALHLPTGVGKTRTGMSIVCDHLRQREPELVVWLAHGQEILDQAASEFERAWRKLGNRPVHTIRMWGSADVELGDIRDGLIVLGVEKAHSAARANSKALGIIASRSRLTVFDEAHQIIAPTYRQVADALTIRHDASLLGLTATPGRTWADIVKDEELAVYFARQKVMLRIEGYSNPVTALIDQGYLSRPHMRTVAAETGIKLTAEDRRQLSTSFDIPMHVMEDLATNEQWNLQVVKTVLDLLERHTRILVFASSVAHCRLVAAVLTGLGIDAAFVTGESSPRERTQTIQRFKSRNPRPMVLCNYGVLTTGFDAPAASAAIIARPTRSLVLYSQMVGRVIRGPKAGGTAECEIVTVVDPGLAGFGDVADAFLNWEDVWETT